jgi:hypothetical protein
MTAFLPGLLIGYLLGIFSILILAALYLSEGFSMHIELSESAWLGN